MTYTYNFDENLQACPLCGSKTFSEFEISVNRGAVLHNQICHRCTQVFLSPRMNPEEVAVFYQRQYRSGDIDVYKPMEWVIEKEAGRAGYQVDFLASWMQRPERLLDVGSSTGQMLRMASQKFNSVSVGVEPGEIYRADAQRTHKIYPSLSALKSAGEPPFDVVVMSHVLEHLLDPVGFLCDLRSDVLKPGGALFIEVPNLYGHSSFEPAHLYAFTDKTLTAVLRAAGFNVKYIKLHSAPRDFGWRNISVLAGASLKQQPIPRRLFLPAWIKFQRTVKTSGTRHWYGYFYQQMKKKLGFS